MIIHPKIRGFICTTAHPTGCARIVAEQIEYVKSQGKLLQGPSRVLIIGASTGYGLASRIAATFGAGAKTIGVFYERPADDKRTASAGWYNTAAFERFAHQEGHYAKSINGDAFSQEIKEHTAELIRQDLKQVDLVIYSLASPRRTHPITGQTFNSVLRPIGQTFTSKTVDPFQGEVKEVTIEPAKEEEIASTVAVMGGEDWAMWMDYLGQQGLLADHVKTLAYTYIGPQLTHAVYKDGTIGAAKNHLAETADELNATLQSRGGQALLSVNKALVTQASAAIPVVPLYNSLLYKVMKEKGIHEGCIEQIERLFKDYIYTSQPLPLDANGRIRLDDWEMRPDVQAQISALWPKITTENLEQLTDIEGYRDDFYRLFGFNAKGVDYDAPVDPDVKIESMDAVTASE